MLVILKAKAPPLNGYLHACVFPFDATWEKLIDVPLASKDSIEGRDLLVGAKAGDHFKAEIETNPSEGPPITNTIKVRKVLSRITV